MKTLEKLRSCTAVDRFAPSDYRVRVNYRGKEYSCRSNNSIAWDRMSEAGDLYECERGAGWLTLRQAYLQFYEECCRKNHIGKYRE